jgi:hypothetical protein
MIKILVAAGIVVSAALGVLPTAQAAPPAQETLVFGDPAPIAGSLGPGADQAAYTFECLRDTVASVHVLTTGGDLEVQIDVIDSGGQPLASGGKISGDPNVSIAEAFVIPMGGACSIQLSRVGQTQGDYEVRLLPGYAQIDKFDTFSGAAQGLEMYWQPYQSDTLQVETINQQLLVNVTTDNMLGYAVPDGDNLTWTDLYIHADVTIEDTPSYAEYGFLVRVNDDDETFYSFTFSSDGDYTLYYFNGEWNVIQEWTISPAVDGTAQRAQIGLWVQGYTFKGYFNGRLAGEVVDANQYAAEGTISLAAGTGVDQLDPLGVYFDNVLITRPAASQPILPFGGTGLEPTPTSAASGLMGMLGGDKTPTPAPTQDSVPFPTLAPTRAASDAPASIRAWNSARPEDIVGELAVAGVVPAGGAVTMTVPSSYGDTSAADWSYYQLASDREFRNFVLSFDARLVSGETGAGCGMSFREAETTESDALVFADGYALLGEWVQPDPNTNADLSAASVYEEASMVIPGIGVTNKVIVVALEERLVMYVNGQRFADTVVGPATGGMALEMYVPSDDSGATVQTYCQLNNIWAWEF